ncbi:kinase [Enterovibrio norvegicus FF-454]|uniref:Kinase n=1 Tax=Enterovibrio norvegicus FF-454 TaxID=1185651 RepID=A0A1E5BW07_9GAMM|nr:PfkB family carbohydrate kinase [Enterovibrio norvegicus]OEE57438.1 kinase [Enterovibrio norvegicus FF-454]
MTTREDEILQLIKDDPFIQQQRIAKLLNISRSSVAVHIMNMTKKGVIRGKGYIVDQQRYVVVIGGTNIDVLGQPNAELIPRDSNPGNISHSAGGVGRNIAENLARLGTDVKLISVVGDDTYGSMVRDITRRAGVDVRGVSVLENETTSTYLSLLDHDGDMLAAVADMSILDKLDVSLISRQAEMIRHAEAIVIDTNLSDTVLAYVFSNFSDQAIYLDTVSATKAMKARPYLSHIHTLKPNLVEGQMISGMTVESESDIDEMADWFIQHGVQRLFLSMGADGILFRTPREERLIRPVTSHIINTNGAGDAFLAGLVHGQIQGMKEADACEFAASCSALAMEHINTINPDITELLVQQRIEGVLC